MDEEYSRRPGIPTDPSPPDVVGQVVGGRLSAHQVLAGRYEIRAQIGAGGMGFVYRAYDQKLAQEIALKVLLPERIGARGMLQRIRREVSAALKVTHPNVCRVFDLGEDGDIWFLTMELVEGRTLRAVLSEGSVEPDLAFMILGQVAAGLEAAHVRGIIHLDLKPENVMVCHDGRAVVVDFGLARSVITGTSSANMAGTLAYMSPEHVRGDALDARSDLFSLGVLAFELLTGCSPFARGSLAAVGTPAPLEVPGLSADVVRAVEQVLTRVVAKRAEDRFASAADFGAALAAARCGVLPARYGIANNDNQEASTPLPTALPRRNELIRWRAGLAALALSAAVIAPVVWSSRVAPAAPRIEERVPDHDNGPAQGRDTAGHLTSRPGIIVAPFENLTGDPSWNALAQGAVEDIRAELRMMHQVRLLDDIAIGRSVASPGQPGATWIVEGSIQRVGEHLRLAAQVRAIDGDSAGEPVAIDGEPARPAELLDSLRQRVLDEVRLLWHAYDRRRWAERGTSSEAARSSLLRYYALVGLGPRLEHVDAGRPLLDEALTTDSNYVPALVERAYLQSIYSAAHRQPAGFPAALADLDAAIVLAPSDSRALVMRCRLIQVALNPADKPTDADITTAINACHTATQADPSSAYVPFVLARLHDLRCEDDLAIAALERALELDRGLSGRILTHIVILALENERLLLADPMSKRLVEFQMEEARLGPRSITRRAGVAPTNFGHVLRAAVLVRMGRFDEAQSELERELKNVVGRMGNPWSEPAAIRGLLRIARHQRRPADPDLERRLRGLEQIRFAETANDPWAAQAIAVSYEWTDSTAAVAWVEKLPPPTSFRQVFDRAQSYHTAGDNAMARRMLAMYRPTEQWEHRCAAWIESKLGTSRIIE